MLALLGGGADGACIFLRTTLPGWCEENEMVNAQANFGWQFEEREWSSLRFGLRLKLQLWLRFLNRLSHFLGGHVDGKGKLKRRKRSISTRHGI
jgi:hypothetical protein